MCVCVFVYVCVRVVCVWVCGWVCVLFFESAMWWYVSVRCGDGRVCGVLKGGGAPGSSRAIGGRTLTGRETFTTSSCFPAKEQSVVKGREAASSPFAGQLLTRLPAADAILKQSWLRRAREGEEGRMWGGR